MYAENAALIGGEIVEGREGQTVGALLVRKRRRSTLTEEQPDEGAQRVER